MTKTNLVCLAFLMMFVEASAQIIPPYANSFDEPGDDAGWTHYANIGTDDWQWGVPTNGAFNSAHTEPWAWYTSIGTAAATVSARFLESPVFDLSQSSEPLVLSFWNKRDHTQNVNYRLEYTVNDGATWTTLDNVATKKLNWSFNSDANNFVYSCVSLDFLMGQAAVKFRFVVGTSDFDVLGWIVDDFTIDVEHYEFEAFNGDTLEVFAPCEEWLIDLSFNFQNQFLQPHPIFVDFYLSTDVVLDETDLLLLSDDMNVSTDYVNWIYALNPVPLSAGNYHIIFVVDATNAVEENDESNNIGVIPLVLNPVTLLNYVDDFEADSSSFGLFPNENQNILLWEHGQGYDFRTVGAHSGTKTWHASRELEGNGVIGYSELPLYEELHTPTFYIPDYYADLSLSFWFKLDRIESSTVAAVEIATIGGCQGEESTPFVAYPAEHHEGWRFFTRDIGSSYPFVDDILKSYVFRVKYDNESSSDDYGMVIDDFYIGDTKPDLGIEGEKNCSYVNELSENVVLNYELVNCGLIPTGPSTTSFYFSSDSLLDAGDILLGDVLEEPVPATTRSARTFTYVKPGSTDDYYVLYVVDALGQIDEMREYDNFGIFSVSQYNVFPTPYFNDFEVHIDEWKHNSSLNEDEWNWSVVNGPVFDQAFSPEKAWLLGDSGRVHTWRLNHLYSPVFDLSGLVDPLLYFEMYHGHISGPLGFSSAHRIALEYSVNGGTAWEALEAVDGATNGSGVLDDYGILSQLPNQQKNTLNATSYYYDLAMLQGQEAVQFRFTAAIGNDDANTDTLLTMGFMIDNFGIMEGNPDLVLQHRELMLSELGDEVIFNTTLYNRGTQVSPNCVVKHFLSTDDQLDAGDTWLGDYTYGTLEPDQLLRSNHIYPAPGLLSDFQFLILQLDPENLIEEIDEMNNIDAWPLTDLVEEFPYIENFNEPGPNGWNFEVEQFGSPVEFGHYISNIYTESTGGVNEEDVIDMGFQATSAQSFASESGTPEFNLYSPPFNFSAYDSIQVSFEVNMEASSDEGVSFLYTLNNGDNWFLFSTEDATNGAGMSNWYSQDSPNGGSPLSGSIDWLNNLPGWSILNDTLLVSGNASSLRENNNVIFRLFAQVSHESNGNGEQGWGIDDFMVETFVADYCAADSMVSHILTNEIQEFFSLTIHAQNVGETNGRPSRTYFYWSADDVLDNSDELAVFYDIPEFSPLDAFFTHEIPMPLTLSPGDVYLFYVLDGDDNLNEINEMNNVGSFVVSIPALINYVADTPQSLLADQNVSSIIATYEVENEGTLDGITTFTKYYWSEDDVFDAGDQIVTALDQSGVAHLSSAVVEHTLEYPIPLEQQIYHLFYELDDNGSLDETNESDNMGVILVDFYNYGIMIGEQDENLVQVYSKDGLIHALNLPLGTLTWKLFNPLGQELASGNKVLNQSSLIISSEHVAETVLYLHFSGEDFSYTYPLILVR